VTADHPGMIVGEDGELRPARPIGWLFDPDRLAQTEVGK